MTVAAWQEGSEGALGEMVWGAELCRQSRPGEEEASARTFWEQSPQTVRSWGGRGLRTQMERLFGQLVWLSG